jgi:hypothetical protein
MATRGRTEDTIPRFQQMRPDQQAAARAGYVDPLIERAQGGAMGVNKAREFTSDAYRDEFAAMAAPGRAPLLADRLARENRMFETRAMATGGSRTADNLADNAALGVNPEILSNIASGNLLAAGRNLLVRSTDNLSGNTPEVRRQLANILLTAGRDPGLRQILMNAARSEQEFNRVINTIIRGTMAGTATGTQGARGTQPPRVAR